MDKFTNKKLCRVCLYPIVFKKDAYWKPASNGKTYPLNIHYKDCAPKVYLFIFPRLFTVAILLRDALPQP